MKNLPFFNLVFLRKRRRWAFLKTRFRPWIHQPSESFGLTLATETTFNSNFCSKTARYRLFLAVVRCCVTTTLAAETFSLLSVYLNYKFGLGLPSFYLFFSLFKNECGIVPPSWKKQISMLKMKISIFDTLKSRLKIRHFWRFL